MTIGVLIFSEPRDQRFSNVDELVAAGEQRGHVMVRLYEPQLSFVHDGSRLHVLHEGGSLVLPDVIIARPNFIEEPSLHVATFGLLQQASACLLNGHPDTLLAKNKLAQHDRMARAGIPMPRWSIGKSPAFAFAAAKEFGFPVIIKVGFGTQGKGVFYADSPETFHPIVDYLAVRDKNALLIEECIVEADRKDLRIFVVGGRIVAAMERTARAGDMRANASIGGTGRAVTLSKEEADLAIRSAQLFSLDIAGVDILRSHRGPLVIEVNSNPGFTELQRATGIDIAAALIEEAEHRADHRTT